jgi:ATP-binding cassette subfamily B (MDR/TAP) protein 7
VGLLVASKLITIEVPFIFKELINEYTAVAPQVTELATAVPLGLVLGYGVARTAGAGFQELRNTIFSVVAQDAIRTVAKDVFRHLLHLDMQFHVNKNSGHLFRVIDRGFLFYFILFILQNNILMEYANIAFI